MNIQEMFSDAQVQLGEVIPFSMFYSALVRVLKRINIEGEKEEQVVQLTGENEDTEAQP